VTINWKMAATVAAGCFVLSFVTGLFAQVHFFALFLRALLLGLLGGALAIAFRALVQRFLPELGEGLGVSAGRAEAEADTGSTVDIVVSDEAGETGEPEELDGTEGSADGSLQYQEGREDERQAGPRPKAERTRSERPKAVVLESEESGDFAEELEELKASPILPGKNEDSQEAYQPVKPPDVIEDVDVLPDLESFSDSFAVQDLSGEGEGTGGTESMPSGSGSSGSRGNVMTDTDTMAQAIRTALHRDKKG
jgi:hypothetical protein